MLAETHQHRPGEAECRIGEQYAGPEMLMPIWDSRMPAQAS
jgi:hypothetical protein